MTNVLDEGGGRVLGAFLDAQQVDAVDVFVAPIIEGGDHRNTPIRGVGCQAMSDALRLKEVAITQVGGDLRMRGWMTRPWRGLAGFPGG